MDAFMISNKKKDEEREKLIFFASTNER